MISFIQRLAITLLIFSSLSNIASAQMTDEAEVQSIPTKSQAENFPVEKLSSLPAKPKPKPVQSAAKCISNCSLRNAISYIKRNFDGRERTVRITVTYDNNGRVTDVQINPSTGNSSYDRVIIRDASRLRFSPGKAGTQIINLRIASASQRFDNSGEIKCISNCSLLNARSYIRRNFDGKERTVRITVTYNKNGKVTDVRISPSTGNSSYDNIIRIDARWLRFSKGKFGTYSINFTIAEKGFTKVREAEERRREQERRRREAEERRREQERRRQEAEERRKQQQEAEEQNNNQSQP